MRILLVAVAVIAFASPAFAVEVVPVPQFRSVELRGGGVVTVVPGPAERVTIIEGSSQYTRLRVERDGKLTIDSCDERCPRLYRLRIEIQSPGVPDLAVSGGGGITTKGGFRPQRGGRSPGRRPYRRTRRGSRLGIGGGAWRGPDHGAVALDPFRCSQWRRPRPLLG